MKLKDHPYPGRLYYISLPSLFTSLLLLFVWSHEVADVWQLLVHRVARAAEPEQRELVASRAVSSIYYCRPGSSRAEARGYFVASRARCILAFASGSLGKKAEPPRMNICYAATGSQLVRYEMNDESLLMQLHARQR